MAYCIEIERGTEDLENLIAGDWKDLITVLYSDEKVVRARLVNTDAVALLETYDIKFFAYDDEKPNDLEERRIEIARLKERIDKQRDVFVDNAPQEWKMAGLKILVHTDEIPGYNQAICLTLLNEKPVAWFAIDEPKLFRSVYVRNYESFAKLLEPFENLENLLVIYGDYHGEIAVVSYESLDQAAEYLINKTWLRLVERDGDEEIPAELCKTAIAEFGRRRCWTNGECDGGFLCNGKDLLEAVRNPRAIGEEDLLVPESLYRVTLAGEVV